MPALQYLENIVTLEYDSTLCNGCTLCVQVCPHAVFQMKDKLAVIIDKDSCMECGACALNCSTEAIQVEKGVGCASAIINGTLRGTEPDCGCSETGCC